MLAMPVTHRLRSKSYLSGPGVANLCIVSPADGVSFSSSASVKTSSSVCASVRVRRSAQGVNENADPDVRTDHLAAIPRLHPPGQVGLVVVYSSSCCLMLID